MEPRELILEKEGKEIDRFQIGAKIEILKVDLQVGHHMPMWFGEGRVVQGNQQGRFQYNGVAPAQQKFISSIKMISLGNTKVI